MQTAVFRPLELNHALDGLPQRPAGAKVIRRARLSAGADRHRAGQAFRDADGRFVDPVELGVILGENLGLVGVAEETDLVFLLRQNRQGVLRTFDA